MAADAGKEYPHNVHIHDVFAVCIPEYPCWFCAAYRGDVDSNTLFDIPFVGTVL